MGDGEKLLTHLNSALKVLLGLDIFPRVPKKKLNFFNPCNQRVACVRNAVTFTALCDTRVVVVLHINCVT